MDEQINLADITYDLPPDRIASFPLAKRDESKLLVYRDGSISHSKFTQLTDYLDVGSLLVFNDTRVVPARILFQKPTGATIEVMLLTPEAPGLVQLSMIARGSCTWRCVIGNQKRWTTGTELILTAGSIELRAQLENNETGVVRFCWTPEQLSFAEVVEATGNIPLPPYIKRKPTTLDRSRYQTVYAHFPGAVAAPTAGLHFTDEIMATIREKQLNTSFVTLHVSAGTFLPIKASDVRQHVMHEEQVVISKELVGKLLAAKSIVAVGTTSMRTLESIYWYGCALELDRAAPLRIGQHDASRLKPVELGRSLENVMARLASESEITGATAIYITPGYDFKVCDALITNFHQPGSTLILLVAAFVGPDWRKVYLEGLKGGYRFLSYGDSSLLFGRS